MLIGIWIICLLDCSFAEGPFRQATFSTKVVLSPSTFSTRSINDLQPIANTVSELIDALIPGKPRDYPQGGIVCFEASPNWNPIVNPPPITLTGPRLPGEPSEISANSIRIAVFAVQPNDKWRFAFQLSHELTHVKMWARSDNYLDETFATAASFEVLRRLGYQGYLMVEEGLEIQKLPPEIQMAIAHGDWKRAKAYWISQSEKQQDSMSDRPFQTLGALLLLRERGPRWADLLDISHLNSCPDTDGGKQFRICPPSFSNMKNAKRELNALGLVSK